MKIRSIILFLFVSFVSLSCSMLFPDGIICARTYNVFRIDNISNSELKIVDVRKNGKSLVNLTHETHIESRFRFERKQSIFNPVLLNPSDTLWIYSPMLDTKYMSEKEVGNKFNAYLIIQYSDITDSIPLTYSDSKYFSPCTYIKRIDFNSELMNDLKKKRAKGKRWPKC